MKTIEILEETKRYPTFDLATFSSILNKEHTYARVYLHRLKERKLIYQLQRDVYTSQDDPFRVASRIIWPSYISLWSALRYHNLTEQNPHAIFVVTPRKKRKTTIDFKNTPIIFKYLKPRYFFGYSKEYLNGFDIFIAEPEKAIIDAVLLKTISLSEIFSILKDNKTTLKSEKLISLVKQTENICLNKRIGWILEQIGTPIHQKISINKTYIRLDYTKPGSGRKNKRWHVIENMETTV